MRHSAVACALWLALLWAGSAGAQIVLSEVLYDPVGSNAGNQWVELRNLGAASADLTGYRLCYRFHYWTFPTGTRISPGGFLVVHIGASGTNTSTDIFTGTYVSALSSTSSGL